MALANFWPLAGVSQVDKDYVPKDGQLPQSYVSPEAIDDRTFIETDLKAYIKSSGTTK